MLPAGTTFDSYLVHFDVGKDVSFEAAGNGSLEFGGKVVAVLTDAGDLAATDGPFATLGSTFAEIAHRGLEAGGDRVGLTDDGRTVAFDLTVDASRGLDQFRVPVLGTPD